MKSNLFKKAVLFILINFYLLSTHALAAPENPSLLKAKQNAETRGYLFANSREEIVAMAKKEGKLSAISSMEAESIKVLREAFKAEYPFLSVTVEEITGTEAIKRFQMELKAGRDTGWDAAHLTTDEYNNFLPFMKKVDILGMAEQRVLQIPLKVIDPDNRNIIVVTSDIQVVAYNKKLISPDKIPNTWEGFLRPELKGKKFLADIRPQEIAALVPAWGLEKTLDFSRKLAAQQPIWVRGATRLLTSMVAGEYALFIGPNFSTVKRMQAKDTIGNLDYRIMEPIPTRITDPTGILNTAKHPFAAILWLDFLAGPKGQKIADQCEPYGASVFSPGSFLAEATRGKKLSLVDWKHLEKTMEYEKKIIEAYGFPTAEIKK